MRQSLTMLIVVLALAIGAPVATRTAFAQSDTTALRALVDAGHYNRARPVVDAWVTGHPNDPEGLALQSQVRHVFKDLTGALASAEKAAALAPNSAAYRFRVAEVVGDQASSAGILKQFGLAKRFKREAEATLALDPNHIDAMMTLMEFHMRAPGLVGGDKKVAQQMLATIKRINPARGYLAEYRMLQLDKKTDPAEPYWLKAMNADPAYYPVKISLARYYAGDSVKRYDEAERIAKDAWKQHHDRIAPAALLVFIYAKQQKWAEVDAVLAESDKISPDGLLPHYQLAATLNQMRGDLTRAEKEIRKYMSLTPEPNAATLESARTLLADILANQKKK